MEDIPEVSFKLDEVTVKSEVRKIRMTVRNMFYVGVWGKVRTMWVWYWYYSDAESWLTYLDSPITYTRELAEDVTMYHGIVEQTELLRLLAEELQKTMGIPKERDGEKNK